MKSRSALPAFGLVIAVVLALGWARLGMAHDPSDSDNVSHEGYLIYWTAKSVHDKEHEDVGIDGMNGVTANVRISPGGETFTGNGFREVQRQLKAELTAPLGGTIIASATCNWNSGMPATYWYSGFTSARVDWGAGPITNAVAHFKLKLGSATLEDVLLYTAHQVDAPSPIASVAAMPTLVWETAAPALVCDFVRGGTPEVTVNEYDEEDLVLDPNGDIVWVTPPATVLRLTSSVTYNGSGSVTYTYRIENFSDDTDYDFSFPDIRTGVFTSGWAGTVEAESYEEIGDTVGSPGQALWRQSTQATYWPTDDEDSVNGRPILVYIPAGRAAFVGATTIQSADYDSGQNRNEVVFRVTTPASEAYLYRLHAGQCSIVDQVVGSLTAATDYTLVDDDYAPGSNVYYVVAGTRTNGSTSSEEEIVNE